MSCLISVESVVGMSSLVHRWRSRRSYAKQKRTPRPEISFLAIAFPYDLWYFPFTLPIGRVTTIPKAKTMSEKTDVWQGTLALMVLKTLEAIGPLHGYGIARRIEQTGEHALAINYGTIYPG
jgi:hypothetical protein